MDEQNARTVFLFTRQGQMAVPDGFPPDTDLENGVAFDERIFHYFGASVKDRLFRATDPGGRDEFSVLLLPAEETQDTLLQKGYRCEPLRVLIHGFAYSRALRMYHLALWREDSRYCGRCGHPNDDADDGEYARVCPRCGRKEFPRISPAILVLIKNEKDEALLAHNANFKDNVYSLIAGFLEAGENLQNTVAREVREEVGIEVRDITFDTSQSWPFPNSLMVGFEARYESGVVRCDNKEITDARWFSRSHLPGLPGKGSVSRFLIDKWLES